MARLSRRSYSAILAVAALPLVLGSLLDAHRGAAESVSNAVQVVNAFTAARASRNLSAIAALLHADATIVDEKHHRTTGTEALFHLLSLAEVFEVGTRHVAGVGEVTWTETVEPYVHPSWESNPNWWLDDVQASRLLLDSHAEAARLSKRADLAFGQEPTLTTLRPASTSRFMRASVVDSRIMQLVVSPADPQPGRPAVVHRVDPFSGHASVAGRKRRSVWGSGRLATIRRRQTESHAHRWSNYRRSQSVAGGPASVISVVVDSFAALEWPARRRAAPAPPSTSRGSASSV